MLRESLNWHIRHVSETEMQIKQEWQLSKAAIFVWDA